MDHNEIYQEVKQAFVATEADVDPAAMQPESTVGMLGLDIFCEFAFYILFIFC